MRIVFCGTAAGTRSAELRQPYAGPGNKFWWVLAEVGLTPRVLSPPEFRDLPQYGIGLTDIAKHASGADSGLKTADFDAAALEQRIRGAAPGVLAFNGKRAAREFYGKGVAYGEAEPIGETRALVLPSTSGLAVRFWDIEPWREAAASAGGRI
jgi:TDG/mug DNA glycosylase family protein